MDVKDGRQKSEVATRKVAKCDNMIELLSQKVQLLTGDYQEVISIQLQIALRDVDLTGTRVAVSQMTRTWGIMAGDLSPLRSDLDVLHTNWICG